jgi:hypothetical protein
MARTRILMYHPKLPATKDNPIVVLDDRQAAIKAKNGWKPVAEPSKPQAKTTKKPETTDN